ncbi:MAG: metallophosphoesterase [Sulfolobaceae archaeon]|nr:metallophosphoesterase [Sulfolobaceae archaeon]
MLELTEGIYVAEDLPVIYIKKINAIVMSDIHIGYEEDMARKGIFIPKIQLKRFLNIYKRAIEAFHTNKVILNGDVKHIFETLGRQEREELNEMFKELKEDGIDVKLVKGNHDNFISKVTSKFDNIELVNEIRDDNLIIIHGHQEIVPEENKLYIIGHEHPRISIRDKLGFSRKFQSFLLVPLRNNSQVLVLPSVGTYQAGNDVSLIHSNYMSTLMRDFSILEEAKPFIIIEGQGIMEFPQLKHLKDLIL